MSILIFQLGNHFSLKIAVLLKKMDQQIRGVGYINWRISTPWRIIRNLKQTGVSEPIRSGESEDSKIYRRLQNKHETNTISLRPNFQLNFFGFSTALKCMDGLLHLRLRKWLV